MIEVWKEWPEDNDYEVSTLGRVRSSRSGRLRILKGGLVFGRRYINNVAVYRMVAQTFLPNPENKPTVNHIDEDPTNNHLTNLEWMTYQENSAYSNNKKVYKRNPLTFIVVGSYPSYTIAARAVGLKNTAAIGQAVRLQGRSAGYYWTKELQTKPKGMN